MVDDDEVDTSLKQTSFDFVQSRVKAINKKLDISREDIVKTIIVEEPNDVSSQQVFATMPSPPWVARDENRRTSTINADGQVPLVSSASSSSSLSTSGSTVNLSSFLRQSSTFTNPEVLPDLINYYRLDPWKSSCCQVRKKFKWSFIDEPTQAQIIPNTEKASSSVTSTENRSAGLQEEEDEDWFYCDIRVEQNVNWANERVRKGIKMAQKNDVKSIHGAMRYFNQALEQVPDHANALVGRGCLQANSAKYDEAVSDFEAALKSEPNHSNARKYLEAVLVKIDNQKSRRQMAMSSTRGPLSSACLPQTRLEKAGKSSYSYVDMTNDHSSKASSSTSSINAASSRQNHEICLLSDDGNALTEVEIRRLLQQPDGSDIDEEGSSSKHRSKHKKSKKDKKVKKEKKHKKSKKRRRSTRSHDSSSGEEDSKPEGPLEERSSDHPILSRTRHKFWG